MSAAATVALVVVCILLALLAGGGWGVVYSLERLRPERQLADTLHNIEAVHAAGVAQLDQSQRPARHRARSGGGA